MLTNILFLAAGLVLILGGANFLTDGASALARRIGVSDLIIGLTIVAFGTSAPELVITVLSALEGSTEIAVGNIVGSNILNILLILGITALIRPVKVESSLLNNDIPLVVLSSLVLLAMGNAPLLDGAALSQLTRLDGVLLLLFFAVFMRYTFAQARKTTAPDPLQQAGAETKSLPAWRSVVYVVGGLAALLFGGNLFVDGASGLARIMGVGEAVIGLTVVAIGTSLPELATSVVAAMKNKAGLAVGNVIGSNIFNAFFVLGCGASVRPLQFGSIGNFDLLAMTVASVLFWVFARFYKRRTIARAEGALLLGLYGIYMAVVLAKA